jgi:hypothetical protein
MHPHSTPPRRKHAVGAPGWRRCSSFKYSRYSQSSRLASGAPRPPRCDAGLAPRAARPRRGAFRTGRCGSRAARAGTRPGRSRRSRAQDRRRRGRHRGARPSATGSRLRPWPDERSRHPPGIDIHGMCGYDAASAALKVMPSAGLREEASAEAHGGTIERPHRAPATACPGSGRKFRTSPETIASNPPSRLGRASVPAMTNDARASERLFRACSMNGADVSQAMTDAGSQRLQMVDMSAPVPHPTSSQ